MLLLHRDQLLFKLACLLPRRWVAIEQARVGTDTIHFFTIRFERRSSTTSTNSTPKESPNDSV